VWFGWIVKNKEWLFSGIGGLVLLGVLRFLIKQYELAVQRSPRAANVATPDQGQIEQTEQASRWKEFRQPDNSQRWARRRHH